MKKIKLFLLLCIFLCSSTTYSQRKKFLGFTPLNDTVKTSTEGTFLLPLLYYTPDTRWAAGAAGVHYFKLEAKDSTQLPTRTSNIQLLADYTQNRQADLWASWNVFTRNENYLLKGDLRFRNFPDKFYGIGNNTSKEQMERYSYNLIQIKSMFLKKVKPDFFIGFDYEFEKEYGVKTSPGGLLETGTIRGSNGGVGSAIGFISVYDSRDFIINAQKGMLFEFSTYLFNNFLGSTFNFFNVNTLYQKYWSVKKNHVIAFQYKNKFNFGNIPFIDMATLGNDDILRGYPKNRFRDKHFMGAQVEYRFPLFWRFGLTTFAGAGDVFGELQDLHLNRIKYSVGTGLRFVVNPQEKLNIRLDYAYGREGGYFYFMVAEAF
jgi:outer membrane protein assembly factor BamA